MGMKELEDRARALSLISATSDSAKRLDIYVDLLARWLTVINLTSKASLARLWTRHIADSAQLLPQNPLAQRWVDIGSGAGFPGIVIAIQLAEVPGAEVCCIESNPRKVAFLRQVASATGVPARILATRVESVEPRALAPVDAVTSRALAALPRLIEFAKVWLASGAIGVFPCGRSVAEQITLRAAHRFEIEALPSRLDPQARIIRVRIGAKVNQ